MRQRFIQSLSTSGTEHEAIDADATWSTGPSGIPSGWTVEDANI